MAEWSAPTLEAFRHAAQRFLDHHAPEHPTPARRPTGLIEGAVTIDELEAARRWRACCFDHGFGWITGPIHLGGAGLTPDHERAFLNLEARYEVPSTSPFIVGRSMLAPAILAHGSDRLCRTYLPRLMRGDLVACQLFSEPDAGSDLASVRTTARRADGGWVVSGRKVWSSMAHLADVGEALVRTDPQASKHAGLTMLLVDMRAPGVTVRPIRQMSGGAEFNEVILDEVWVPDHHRIGAEGEGWSVALTTLTSERGAAQSGDALRDAAVYDRLRDAATDLGRSADPVIRDALSRQYVAERLGGLLEQRLRHAIAHGANPSLQSLTKLHLIARLQHALVVASTLLGPSLVATEDAHNDPWGRFALDLPALRIAGGTDEIVRNTLAERVLGLPRR